MSASYLAAIAARTADHGGAASSGGDVDYGAWLKAHIEGAVVSVSRDRPSLVGCASLVASAAQGTFVLQTATCLSVCAPGLRGRKSSGGCHSCGPGDGIQALVLVRRL